MNPQTVIPTPPRLLPPVVVLSPLLLTELSPVTRLADPREVMPETLKLRATQITVVLSGILEQQGYPHGGINE
jgi:hypothetical protein